MNKKIGIILFILFIVLILLLTICTIFVKKNEGGILPNEETKIINNAKIESRSIKETKQIKPNEITTNEYFEKYGNSEKSIILISRNTCEYCKIVEPIIFNIAYEEKIEINYLDIEKLTPYEQDTIVNSNEYLKENFDIPLLLIVGDNNIIDKVNGLTDKTHFLEFFQKNNILKKEK